MQNLISNAIKYTPRGRVLVGCRRHGQSLQIGIYDTGVGIPVLKRGEIFKEFHRLEQGARIARGLGLGLSIVERLARVLNHGIALDAIASGGSFFSVTVPTATAINHTTAVTSATPLSRTPMSGSLIVCVENDAAILDGMKTLLTGWDAEVIAVADPEAAIEAIEAAKKRVTGLLVDYHLDRGNGDRRDPGHSPPLRRRHSGHPDHRGSQSACAGRGAGRERRRTQQAGQAGIPEGLIGSVAHPADGGGRIGACRGTFRNFQMGVAMEIGRRLVSAMMALAIIVITPAGILAQDAREVLAPKGRLRVGVYPGSPTSMVRQPSTGEAHGLSLDLGQELARRLGVPFEQVNYQRIADVLEGMKAGESISRSATPRRYAHSMSHSARHCFPRTRISGASDFADRQCFGRGQARACGSVSLKAARQSAHFPNSLPNATVVPAQNVRYAIQMFERRELDAYATNKPTLFEMSDQMPGARVLDGRWGEEHLAVAIPKGRDGGMEYVRRFVAEVQSSGLLAKAVQQAGLRGSIEAK